MVEYEDLDTGLTDHMPPLEDITSEEMMSTIDHQSGLLQYAREYVHPQTHLYSQEVCLLDVRLSLLTYPYRVMASGRAMGP